MKWIMLGVLALFSSVTHAQDYCSVDCGNLQHTMCLYKTENPGILCKDYAQHFLTDQDKKLILDKHNELRRLVANGGVPFHPKARHMVDLKWSEENALIARRWALQCDYRPLKHDDCRRLKDGTYAGQNLFMSSSTAGFVGNMLMPGVQWWFNEHRIYEPDEKNMFPPTKIKESLEYGHYSQMVWAKTTHVGCERAYSDNNEELVCNYSPGGNVRGEPVYEPGEPVYEPVVDERTVPVYEPLVYERTLPVYKPGVYETTSRVNETGEVVNEAATVRHGSCFFTLLVPLVLAFKSKLVTCSLFTTPDNYRWKCS